MLYPASLLSGGTDPILDMLILDFHRETAAQWAVRLQLRTSDLNLNRGSVLLREKYGHEREVPASRELLYRITGLFCGVVSRQTGCRGISVSQWLGIDSAPVQQHLQACRRSYLWALRLA